MFLGLLHTNKNGFGPRPNDGSSLNPDEAQTRRFCVDIYSKTRESTFGPAVIHHRTGRPHGDLAGLRVAASAVHCMQSKPEYEQRKTTEAFH